MSFKDASKVWNVVSAMLQAEQPRARNRARINAVFNGNPPFTEEEARDNKIQTNVNFLEGTSLAHDARSQLSGIFLKPGRYFNLTTDYGRKDKRSLFNAIVTLVPDLAEAAAARADEMQARGEALGPLHGLPVAHKDLLETRGIRTTFGSPLYRDYIPTEDDLVVERIANFQSRDLSHEFVDEVIGDRSVNEYPLGRDARLPGMGEARDLDLGRRRAPITIRLDDDRSVVAEFQSDPLARGSRPYAPTHVGRARERDEVDGAMRAQQLTAGRPGVYACLSAIEDRQPYRPWSNQMIAVQFRCFHPRFAPT